MSHTYSKSFWKKKIGGLGQGTHNQHAKLQTQNIRTRGRLPPLQSRSLKSHCMVPLKSQHDVDTWIGPQPTLEAWTYERERSICCCQPLRSGAHLLLHITQSKLTDTSWKSTPLPQCFLSIRPCANSISTPPSLQGDGRNVSHFTVQETEAYRGQDTCPQSQRLGPVSEPRPCDSEEPHSPASGYKKHEKLGLQNHNQLKRTAMTQQWQSVLPENRVNSSGTWNAFGVLRCHQELCCSQGAEQDTEFKVPVKLHKQAYFNFPIGMLLTLRLFASHKKESQWNPIICWWEVIGREEDMAKSSCCFSKHHFPSSPCLAHGSPISG